MVKLLNPGGVVGVGVGVDEVVGKLLGASVVPESTFVLNCIEARRGTIWQLPVDQLLGYFGMGHG